MNKKALPPPEKRTTFALVNNCMITKKIAVPLINEKILQQAEHCYFATAAITDEGFEFIRTRISTKCKIDIVTSLDEPSSPAVLNKILRHYQGRINLNIYTRNSLHANLYVFDLPFRKSVAFVGSGTLSLEGLKDHEELFWKITDAKEVESLMSWYTTYFQFSVPLNENIVREYELLYPQMMQRQMTSRNEKDQLIALTASSFSWDSVRFKNQYFKKEDYQVFSFSNVFADNASLRLSRAALQEKLFQLHEMVKEKLVHVKLKLAESAQNIDPAMAPDRKIDSFFLKYYSKGEESLVKFQLGINQLSFFIAAEVGNEKGLSNARAAFHASLEDPMVRSKLFATINRLPAGCSIEVAGKRKAVEAFQQEQLFVEFLQGDRAGIFPIRIEKSHSPGDPSIHVEAVGATIIAALERLSAVFM
jgi:hypothetical protein